jgi:hypothetical protein
MPTTTFLSLSFPSWNTRNYIRTLVSASIFVLAATSVDGNGGCDPLDSTAPVLAAAVP